MRRRRMPRGPTWNWNGRMAFAMKSSGSSRRFSKVMRPLDILSNSSMSFRISTAALQDFSVSMAVSNRLCRPNLSISARKIFMPKHAMFNGVRIS